jgi:hypothetical protein
LPFDRTKRSGGTKGRQEDFVCHSSFPFYPLKRTGHGAGPWPVTQGFLGKQNGHGRGAPCPQNTYANYLPVNRRTPRRHSNSTAEISGARAADDVERFICHFLCVSFHRILAAVVYHSYFKNVKGFNVILRIHAS